MRAASGDTFLFTRNEQSMRLVRLCRTSKNVKGATARASSFVNESYGINSVIDWKSVSCKNRHSMVRL